MTIAGALILTVAALVLPATQASATGLGTNCVGTSHSQFSPAMTNDPQLIHSQTTHHFFPCVGLGAPIAGISVSSGSSVTSCTNLASPFEDVPISGTIEWSNGAESDFEGLAKRERVEGTVVATTIGTVTYGLFAGYDLLRVTTTPNLDLAVCDEPGGLQETNGYTTLSILPPLL